MPKNEKLKICEPKPWPEIVDMLKKERADIGQLLAMSVIYCYNIHGIKSGVTTKEIAAISDAFDHFHDALIYFKNNETHIM